MARSIMIQGTMSNAGKSLIAAGLCRIFAQDGYKTAPFKSQNMALNSFITEDGLEMGRAQVVQAEAAGVKPSADMNPILLKPTTDVGSQVIVNGVSIGNMRAKDYFAYKKQLIPDIRKAFRKLEEYADIIVNLQMKNDSYHLIKHFDDGMLDNIRSRFDKAGALNFMQRFNQLGDAIVQLKEAGVPPESEKGQRAAEEYWGLLMEFTNGDVSMLPELIKIGKMDAAENAWEQRQKLVNEYIEPALQAYFSTCEAGPFGKGGKGKE